MMLIRQIQYFVTLARERHFARAAQACQVSQPALSAGLQKLEEELGVALIQRGHRYQGLTADGEHLLVRAQRILADWEALHQEATLSAAGELKGRLRLGVIPTAMPVVPLLTAPCQQSWPGMRIVIRSCSGEQIIRDLESFELDIGLTYLEEQALDGFRRIPLYRERYALLARDPRGLDGRKDIDWATVAAMPLCLLTPEMHNRRIIDAAFRRAGVEPRVLVEADTIFAVYEQVRCAGLFSVVPHSMLTLFELRQEVLAIPILPELSRPIGLVARSDEPLPPLTAAALTMMGGIDMQSRVDGLIDTIY
jgi:DNA-binding transcriptional LysR family regulator